MLCLGVLECVALVHGFDSEIISDITMPQADEGRALEIKSQHFWQPVQQAASKGAEIAPYHALCDEVEGLARSLPAENTFARQALLDATAALRRATSAVLAQADDQTALSTERLQGPTAGWGLGWARGGLSFLTGGQWGGIFSLAVARFVDGGNYQRRLHEHIQERRADSAQMLRGAASSTGSVLSDCRLASKRSFDLLKYDIYQKGVPKTPAVAKEAANRIIDAAAETRKRFLGLVMETVKGITRDAEGEHDQPSATVAHALATDARPESTFQLPRLMQGESRGPQGEIFFDI